MSVPNLLPCPFCGSEAKMISCMGEWVSAEVGYGPDGRRVVCRNDACSVATWPAYGDNRETRAAEVWNARAPVVGTRP